MAQPVITAVTPVAFANGEVGIVITGTDFGASGTVELSNNPAHGAGTLVAQTDTAWSATEITFTSVQGALSSGALSLFVTNDDPLTSDAFDVFLHDETKAATDEATGVEEDMSTRHLAYQLVAASSVADATKPPQGAAIFRVPAAVTGGTKIIAIYQTGSSGAGGLVFRQSDDQGISWSSEVQISTRTDVYPAGVMNPSTGDVHLLYGLLGSPALSATWSVWSRVLAFNGTTWTVGGETAQLTGSAAQGFSNVTAVADADGAIIAMCNRRPSSGNWQLHSIITNTPWDLSNTTKVDELATFAASEARPLLVRGETATAWELILVYEQAGTFRIYSSAETGLDGAFTLALRQTFFDDSTTEFSAAFNSLPQGSSFGQLMIVQHDGDTIIYRTWTPATNTLGVSAVLDGDASNPCSYPSIVSDGQWWTIAWMKQIAANQRTIKLARTDSITLHHYVATDDAADGWAWLKMTPAAVDESEMLLLLWCETLNTPYDVHMAVVYSDIFKTAPDTGAAAETFGSGPISADTGTGTELDMAAGENIDADDVGGISDETMEHDRDTPETGTAAEVFVNAVLRTESGAGSEVVRLAHAIAEAMAAADAAVASEAVPVAETGDGDDEPVVHPLFDGDTGRGTDSALLPFEADDEAEGSDLFARLIPVEDAGAVDETFDDDEVGLAFNVGDTGKAIEVFGSGGSVGRIRHDIIGLFGNRSVVYPGLAPQSSLGWGRGAITFGNETKMKLFSFELEDPDNMGNIVFYVFPLDQNGRWSRLFRSSNAGQNFVQVGANMTMVSHIAYGSDGTLWATCSDNSVPSNYPGSYGSYCQIVDPSGNNARQATRQIYKSVDKGLTWSRVLSINGVGAYCRWTKLTQIAVDPNDPSRIMACGQARGAVNGAEREFVSSTDGGVTWTVVLEGSTVPMPTANLGGDGFGWGDNEKLFAADDGRFIFGGNERLSALSTGPTRIWTTDDMGLTWNVTLSQSPAHPIRDIVGRDGAIYLCRADTNNEDPTEQLYVSLDNGETWNPLDTPPETTRPGDFLAMAYDWEFEVLYLAVGNGTSGGIADSACYRMDDPPGGTWVAIQDDLATVIEDGSPLANRQGLAVLASITGSLQIGQFDSASASEFLPVIVEIDDTADGADVSNFAFQVFDAVTMAEVLEILRKTGLTIRLFMRSGRAIIRVEGSQGPAVIGNPEG